MHLIILTYLHSWLGRIKPAIFPKRLKIQGGPKNGTIFLYALTLPNINRFSKFFHYQSQEKICNNTVAKDS